MIDSAVDNINWGQNYMHQHPVSDHVNIAEFFSDTIDSLSLFKALQLRGHYTAAYLEHVQNELNAANNDLLARHTEADDHLARYVQAAINEVNVARYMEEHRDADGHGYAGHGYAGHGYTGQGYAGHGFAGLRYAGHGYDTFGRYAANEVAEDNS